MSTQKGISRRQFLIGAAGASVAMVGGAAVLAGRQPDIHFDEYTSTTADSQPGKVLVAYGSQYGSTSGVAAEIAKTLCASGIAADAYSIANAPDLSLYSAVILGAPVISDKWMPNMVRFIEANRSRLQTVPTAYFLTCMTLGLTQSADAQQKVAGVLAAVETQYPEVKPIARGLFPGALDYNKMSYLMRWMYQAFAEDDSSGDFRDWNAIRAWAKDVSISLSV